MILEIDYREKKLIELIKKLKEVEKFEFNLKESNLELGDMIIKDDSENTLLIFERKTPSDLASSIQDGRYKEQSFRLTHSETHNHNIIYLIEGSIENFHDRYGRIKKPALYSSLVTLQYYKGFSVIQTRDMLETAYTLLRYLGKLNREKNKLGFYSGNREFENSDYSTMVKSEKKQNITKDNIGKIMLCNVPSVSSQTANVLMEGCESLDDFITKCKENPEFLDNKVIVSKDGKTRKISKKVIQNIRELLF